MPDTHDRIIRDAYYDPEVGMGMSARRLYLKLKPKHPSIKLADVQRFTANQETTQVRARLGTVRWMPIVSNIDGSYQIDLIFYPAEYHTINNGVKAALVCVEVTTRWATCITMKRKKTADTLQAFRTFLAQAKKHCFPVRIVTSDKGSEFISKEFKQLLKQHKILPYLCEEGDKTRLGIVNRFCRTIKAMLGAFMTTHKTKKWIDALPKMLKSYNETQIRTIRATPNQAVQSQEVRERIRAERRTTTGKTAAAQKPIQVGDTVRILLRHKLFEGKEGTRTVWSGDLHKVTHVSAHSVKVEGMDRVYKRWEVKPVSGAVGRTHVGRQPTSHDVEQTLATARKQPKRAVPKPQGKPEHMRKAAERRQTQTLAITELGGGTGRGSKTYKEQQLVRPAPRRTRRTVDRASIFTVGVFCYLRNIPKRNLKQFGVAKSVNPDNPVFWIARVQKLLPKKMARLDWYRETKDGSNQYRKRAEPVPFEESLSVLNLIDPQPRLVRGAISLDQHTYDALHRL